jgi:mRNA interferase RelE/StbE
MFDLRIQDEALQELEHLDKASRKRIIQKIRWLQQNIGNITPLRLSGNFAGFYKLRVGDYRAIYEIIQEKQIIVVHIIGHRRDVYEK